MGILFRAGREYPARPARGGSDALFIGGSEAVKELPSDYKQTNKQTNKQTRNRM